MEAITSKACDQLISYETLETLGDAFLKFATTVHLYQSFPHAHEGTLPVPSVLQMHHGPPFHLNSPDMDPCSMPAAFTLLSGSCMLYATNHWIGMMDVSCSLGFTTMLPNILLLQQQLSAS